MGRERLAARRRELGLSQEDLAHQLGHDATTVRRWEAGRTTPQPLHRRPLANALQITLVELNDMLTGPEPSTVPAPIVSADWSPDGAARLCDAIESVDTEPITADTAPRLVHAWLVVEPPQLVELAAGRRVGSGLAAQVARRVERLRHLDDHVAGADLEAAVRRELAATVTLVRDASYTDTEGRTLLSALGDLCQLAGWAAADASRDAEAAHYYVTGTVAAHAAADRPLAGQLVSTLAYHVTNTGRPGDAVLLAQSAIVGAAATATAAPGRCSSTGWRGRTPTQATGTRPNERSGTPRRRSPTANLMTIRPGRTG